jgi:GMP synthase-like glutamine amidotransferase
MIIFVVVAPSEEAYDRNGDRFDLKRRLEKLSGEPCLVLHDMQITSALVEDLQPKVIILSGFGDSFEEFDVRSFYPLEEVIKTTDVPIMAICGSHQLLGYMYNYDLHSVVKLRDEPMRRLRLGELDLADYHSGYFKEYGFYPVKIVKDDPIFEGLPNPFVVREAHYCEVKALAHNFDLLASTEECPIQAMKHKSRMIYGVQFHPEAYSEYYQHGKVILENFFRLSHENR